MSGTVTAGHPAHAVWAFTTTEPAGELVTEWQAPCGRWGRLHGPGVFTLARQIGEDELCRRCFPAGHNTDHPDPIEVRTVEPDDPQCGQPPYLVLLVADAQLQQGVSP